MHTICGSFAPVAHCCRRQHVGRNIFRHDGRRDMKCRGIRKSPSKAPGIHANTPGCHEASIMDPSRKRQLPWPEILAHRQLTLIEWLLYKSQPNLLRIAGPGVSWESIARGLLTWGSSTNGR